MPPQVIVLIHGGDPPYLLSKEGKGSAAGVGFCRICATDPPGPRQLRRRLAALPRTPRLTAVKERPGGPVRVRIFRPNRNYRGHETYRLRLMALVVLVFDPPAGVKLPLAVSLRCLAPLSSRRPLAVSVIVTLALPAWWKVTLAVAISTGFFAFARCAPFGTRYQLIIRCPALGAENETT